MRPWPVIIITLFTASQLAAEVPVVTNPREAPVHHEVAFTEVWRAGAEESSEFLFGVIADATCDGAGNVYLLDIQQQCVFKFGPEGRYLGMISRRGEGPGEIDLVYSLGMFGSDSVGLLKVFPPEVVVVDTLGTPRPSFRPALPELEANATHGFYFALVRRGGAIIGLARANQAGGSAQAYTDALVSLQSDGSVRHCFGTKAGGYDFSRKIVVDEVGDRFPHGVWALGDGGEVYLAPDRDRWLIEVRDLEGDLRRTIVRDWARHRRTEAEKNEVKKQYSFSSTGDLPPISYVIDDHDPPIAGLSFRAGELRVYSPDRQRHLPDGVADRFDVLDPAGHLQGERSCLLPFNREMDSLIHLEDGRIVRVKNFKAASAAMNAQHQVQVGEGREVGGEDEAEVLEVVVYRAGAFEHGLQQSSWNK